MKGESGNMEKHEAWRKEGEGKRRGAKMHVKGRVVGWSRSHKMGKSSHTCRLWWDNSLDTYTCDHRDLFLLSIPTHTWVFPSPSFVGPTHPLTLIFFPRNPFTSIPIPMAIYPSIHSLFNPFFFLKKKSYKITLKQSLNMKNLK